MELLCCISHFRHLSSFVFNLCNSSLQLAKTLHHENGRQQNCGEFFSVFSVSFLAFFIFHVGMEMYQAYMLKKQYFEELENYIEWSVLLSALLFMIKTTRTGKIQQAGDLPWLC